LRRFSARRSIPAHAVELKKYRCGIEPVSSTCDNEHTAASLGHSEILGIEDSPRDCSRGSKHTTSVRPFAPCRFEFAIFAGKCSQKATEGVVFAAEDSGDVFPYENGGLLSASKSSCVNGICEFHIGQGELAARIGEAAAKAGYAERLAGRAADKDIGSGDFASRSARGNGRHVAEIRHIRVMVREDGAREFLDFSEPSGFPAKRVPRNRSGFYATAHGSKDHKVPAAFVIAALIVLSRILHDYI
jgi:hypothetical protein